MECPLSEKQLDVIRWLADGKTGVEIAEILGIKKAAVYGRIKTSIDSTGSANLTGLVAMCLRKGWIE